jgi:hypothetical protein
MTVWSVVRAAKAMALRRLGVDEGTVEFFKNSGVKRVRPLELVANGNTAEKRHVVTACWWEWFPYAVDESIQVTNFAHAATCT